MTAEGRLSDPEAPDLSRQLAALRDGAALLDDAPPSATGRLGVVHVRGSDRVGWLNGMVTSAVKELGPRAAQYAAVCNAKGKMLTDLWVLNAAPDAEELLVLMDRERLGAVLHEIDKLLVSEDASFEDTSAAERVASVQGARAREVAAAAGLGARGFPVDRAGHGGVEIVVPAAELPAVRQALLGAGAEPAGEMALEIARIEAGYPRWGADMSEGEFPQEAGIEGRAVSFTKGCYVGQETVYRIYSQGHVNRRLVGLRLGQAPPPEAGTPIVAGDKEVGRVTSAARSPRLNETIALGYVRREQTAPGTEVRVSGHAATVSALPF